MKDLIKKLKNNEAHRIYADMTKAEQLCLEGLREKNAVELLCDDGEKIIWHKEGTSPLFLTSIYRIKPDYNPEPEYIDLEIEEHKGYLGVWKKTEAAKYKHLPFQFTHLHALPSLSNFEDFRLDNKSTCIEFEDVASFMSEDHKVYARFRKE